ncbi:MAG TPA: cytochrome c oxidase subunit I [Acidimicrobiia bacterium]|nr:cytochrome c oxidase subunit I [Acidimicrobiia bacterium]
MAVAVTRAPARPFARPKAEHGFWSWISTVDHKRIGILYGVTAFLFFLVGGLEALLIRTQLAEPNGTILTAEEYNQLFTMHGTTMVFLVIMPLAAAFGNYFVPILIGARDVAFPRLNAFGFWVFLAGGLLLYSSFLLGGAPNGGWFGYSPQTAEPFSPGNGMDFWLVGLVITGIGSLTAAANFIVTTLNLRAPGMTLMRMPVFVWMNLVVSFLLLFAIPIITVALFELYFDRNFGSNFFNANMGGDPVLWQHLFWLFGHPEVYILILPAMGIVSEVLPVFSRKPLFGYSVVVFSGIAIGFMGWGVWAHHMFAVGLGPVANSAFAASTMFIAVPTGVKIFNWLATTWGGDLRLKTPMLFALGFIGMFTIGGLSGVTHSIVPSDYQQTDTYYIVAHFHYVLFGGAILGLFAGAYYWAPVVIGKLLDEKLGKIHFWLMLVGFNLAFGPMHILGLQGQPRRTYRYPDGMGWTMWNRVATLGAFLIAVSLLFFIANVIKTLRSKEKAPTDPWDARTLEWTIPTPPPEYNFAEIPVVHARDDFWHRKYTEDEQGRLVRIPAGGSDEASSVTTTTTAGGGGDGHGEEHGHGGGHGHGIHMPSPSYFPALLSLGIMLVGYGAIYHWMIGAVGGVIVLAGVFGWGNEPLSEEH